MLNNACKSVFAPTVMVLCAICLPLSAAGKLESVWPQLNVLVADVNTYDYGPDRTALAAFDSLLNTTPDRPDLKAEIEALILDQMQSNIADGAMAYYAEKLCLAGSKKSLPVLKNLLTYEGTFDAALYALTGSPAADADKVLMRSLSEFEQEKLIGIIQALGTRKSENSLKKLYPLVQSDIDVAKAAVISVGQIGEAESILQLKKLSEKASPELIPVMQEAMLLCAADLDEKEKQDALYLDILINASKPCLKLAASRSWILSDPENAEARILSILSDGDPHLYCEAISLLRHVEHPDEKTWSLKLFELPVSSQICLLHVIADKNLQKTVPHVVSLLHFHDRSLRREALNVISKIGNAYSVLPLAYHAAGGNDIEETAAALANIPGEGVDSVMLNALVNSDAPVKIVLINALGERRYRDAVDEMKVFLESRDKKLRIASTQALGLAASHQTIPSLIQNLTNEPVAAEKQAIEKAIYKIAQRSAVKSVTETYVMPVFQSGVDEKFQKSLLELIGNLGEAAGMRLLQSHLDHQDQEMQLAAVRGLSSWPDASPVADLISVAKKHPENRLKIIAVRGASRLLEKDAALSDSAKIIYYEDLLKLEHQAGEIRLILSGLSKLKTLDAIDLIKPLYAKETYKTEAEFAIMTLLESWWWQDTDKTFKYLNEFAESDNATIRRSAKKLKYSID